MSSKYVKEILDAQMKRQGKAQGETFELDIATWLLMEQYIQYQAHNSYDFSFFPGFDDIDKLEDIVIRYERNSQERIIFVQAKHVLKSNKNITDQDLFSLDGNYSLLMYCNAYLKAQNNVELLQKVESKHSNSNVEFKDIVEECILATCKGLPQAMISQYFVEDINNQKLNIGNRKIYKLNNNTTDQLMEAFKSAAQENQNKLTAFRKLNDSKLKQSIDEFLGKLIFVTNLPRQGIVGDTLEKIIKDYQLNKIKIDGKLLEQAEIDNYFNALQYLIFRKKGANKTLITPKELDELFSYQKHKLNELLINRKHSKKIEAFNISFTEKSIKDSRENKLQDFLLPKRVLNIITAGKTAKAENVLQALQALQMQELTRQDLATLPKLEMLAQSIIQSKKSKNQFDITFFKQNDLHLAFIQGDAGTNHVREKLKENLETIINTPDLNFKAIFISTINLLAKAQSNQALTKNPLYKLFHTLDNQSLYKATVLENVVDDITIKKFIEENKRILHVTSLDPFEFGYIKLNQVLCDSITNTNATFFIELDSLLEQNINYLPALSKYTRLIIDCSTSITNNVSNQILPNILDNNPNLRIILATKQGFNVQSLLSNQAAESCTIKHHFRDLKLTYQQDLLTRKLLIFLENKEKINLKELMGIGDLNKYLSNAQNQNNINAIIPIETLVQLIKHEDINIGSGSAGNSDLAGAYSQLYLDINVERLINNLSLNKDNIFVISGINGSEKSKSFIDKLKSFDSELQIDNLDPNQISDFHLDTKHSSRILLDDDKLQEMHFKQLCQVNENKKIYWISLKDGSDNTSEFILQQIYNPDFTVDRQFYYFKKVIFKKSILKELKTSYNILFLITCLDEDKMFSAYDEKLIHRFCDLEIKNKSNGQARFEQLVKSNKNKSIHWLDVEQNNGNIQIVWIKSYGTLDILRQHIDHEKSIQKTAEKDFVNDIQDKKVVIIADDPGMGKTTSLIKLCTLQYALGSKVKSMFQSHWVISINLKDYISTIDSIKSCNIKIDDIINLCLEADSSINTPFTKKILSCAFKNPNFIKPILIKFDGFDEVLDQNIRDKVILLMQYLIYDHNVKNIKIWITSRLHYEQTLENALSTFATKFEPLDEIKKKEYMYQFFKNRLHLTLSENQFSNTFGDDVNKVHDVTSKIGKFSHGFFTKMQDTFKDDNTKFIGIPLQLHLMLEGSTKFFKEWITNDPNHDKAASFDYLGDNMLSVYENYIENIYNIFFKKWDVRTTLLQKQLKIILDHHHQDFAKSLILNFNRTKSLEEFRDIVLAGGIIRCNGNDIEFIHPTFKEYFAAQVFMHWIEKCSANLENFNKQKYLLTEILLKPDYKIIRHFIDLQLKKLMKDNTTLPQTTLRQYGKLMDDLWEPRLNPLIVNYDQTILYIAVTEENTQIINFILDSIYDSATVLNGLLTKKTCVPHGTVFERNVLYIAAKQLFTEHLKTTQGGDNIAKQKLYENIIETFLAITNGRTETQKKMLLTTFFHQEYAKDPVNKYLFGYIDTKHSDNNSLKFLTNLIKEKEYLVKELEAIWKKGDKINIQDLEALSSQIQDQDVMSALLNIKFSYNTSSNDSILHRAVAQEFRYTDMSDRLKIVQWLITHGADINAINTHGVSVLHASNTIDIINFLLNEQDTDVHVINKDGWTSLHRIANLSDDTSSIICLLVDRGININAKNNIGQTALHFDANAGPKHFNNIKKLVELNADINVPDNYGWTALHTFAAAKSWDCFKFLISQPKVDVYARNEYGYSALDIACYRLRKAPRSIEKNNMLDYLYQSGFLNHYNIESVSDAKLLHPCTTFINLKGVFELYAHAMEQLEMQ